MDMNQTAASMNIKPDEYPLTVVTVTIPSYNDHGSVYVLTLPTGETAEINDGEDDYWALANVIDNAFPI